MLNPIYKAQRITKSTPNTLMAFSDSYVHLMWLKVTRTIRISNDVLYHKRKVCQVKRTFPLLNILFLIFALFLSNASAQGYTKWHLPDHAKDRLGKGSINEIAYAPNGNKLAIASSIGIWIYDAHTLKALRLLIGHTSSVESVSFSPDGKTIATGSSDDTVRLWDTATGRHLKTLTGHTSSVESVSFSPDGKTIATGSSDDTVRLWDTATGRHLKTLIGHTGSVESVSFSPNGKTIATGGGSWDKTVRLWDANTGQHLKTLIGHTRAIYSVSFSPDGRTIASCGSWDKTVRLWDTATGQHLKDTHRAYEFC